MPAGDLLPTSGEDYAAEARGLLIAARGFGDADWWIRDLSGFGDADVADQDVDNPLVDGTNATADKVSAPLIVLSVMCATGATSDAELAAADLTEAFTAGTDDVLHLYVPGRGHVYMNGRYRGAKVTSRQTGGAFQAVAQFLATDPTIYEAD